MRVPPLWITGHSLGGAVSATGRIQAVYNGSASCSVAGVYTFASLALETSLGREASLPNCSIVFATQRSGHFPLLPPPFLGIRPKTIDYAHIGMRATSMEGPPPSPRLYGAFSQDADARDRLNCVLCGGY